MNLSVPGSKTNRVEIIDILRGFALLGVLLVHITGEFAGWSSLYIDPQKMASLSTAKADSAVNFGIYLLFMNKSRALFSFLFGVGFFFQLHKAGKHNISITHKFLKRMFVLFIIGALHAYLLWAGDILRVYAVCGVCLLLFYKLKPNTLLLTGIFLTVIIPALNTILKLYLPHNAVTAGMQQAMYNGYKGESYFNLLRANMARDKAFNLDPYSIGGFYLVILGNFILGFWAAKKDVFTKLLYNKKLVNKICWISLVSGVACSPSFMRLLIIAHVPPPSFAMRHVLAFAEAYSYQVTACFTLCLIVMLYQKTFWKKMLLQLIPAGKMTLTNYIMHSLLAVILFFGVGFGLFGRFGSSITLIIGIIFYVLQVFFSKLWLQHFNMGPLEFLWRSILEGKWQQIKKQRVNPVILT